MLQDILNNLVLDLLTFFKTHNRIDKTQQQQQHS
jgi:hypothetical protein